MKLKCLPEDFQVEELPTVTDTTRGRFTYYRLTKRGLGTLEAVEAIRRRWNLAGQQVRYGGLKDRHALTMQYLTILNGPDRPLRETSFELEPLGHLPHPYGPAHFQGNRFVIVLRDLTGPAADRALSAARRIPDDGLPNYFDDQRFGSLGASGEFIGHAWLRDDHERALWLAMAEPNPADRGHVRALKAILRESWGDWPTAKTRLPRSHERSIVTYLVDHPSDFRGAFARLNRDLRSLYFSAFQSHLWNLLLGRFLEQSTRPEQRVPIAFKSATLPIHRDLLPEQSVVLRGTRLPLPSSRTVLHEGPIRDLAETLLAELGLDWQRLRVRHLKDVFFSKGDRPILFFPRQWGSQLAADELHPQRQKLEIAFVLPKGAYATLVVKRLTDAS